MRSRIQKTDVLTPLINVLLNFIFKQVCYFKKYVLNFWGYVRVCDDGTCLFMTRTSFSITGRGFMFLKLWIIRAETEIELIVGFVLLLLLLQLFPNAIIKTLGKISLWKPQSRDFSASGHQQNPKKIMIFVMHRVAINNQNFSFNYFLASLQNCTT
jgi:hypothetical protein